MTKLKTAFSIEGALSSAGVNVSAAKAALQELDGKFGGQHGDIPAGALGAWVDAWFDPSKGRAFFMEIGRAWEDDIAATLPEARKKEREMTADEWIAARK